VSKSGVNAQHVIESGVDTNARCAEIQFPNDPSLGLHGRKKVDEDRKNMRFWSRAVVCSWHVLRAGHRQGTGFSPDRPWYRYTVRARTLKQSFWAEGFNKAQKHASGNGIYYHGGPLLGTTNSPTPNVYLIWYGNWSGNSAITILTNLVSHIGGSAYFNINTTYYDGAGYHVANAVNYRGSAKDNYSQGTSLTDTAIREIVTGAISGGKLPLDPDGVYFVLTSKDVNETSGF
jgi:hypothetical protein